MGPVDADRLAALRTGPLLFFVSYELPYAGLLYFPEIFDHAHAVFGSVALIKLLQAGAGKLFAADAELCLAALYPVTVFDSARQSAYLFNGIVTSAPRAYILLSRIGHAQPAAHSARSDQSRGHRFRLCRFSRPHLSILKIGSKPGPPLCSAKSNHSQIARIGNSIARSAYVAGSASAAPCRSMQLRHHLHQSGQHPDYKRKNSHAG